MEKPPILEKLVSGKPILVKIEKAQILEIEKPMVNHWPTIGKALASHWPAIGQQSVNHWPADDQPFSLYTCHDFVQASKGACFRQARTCCNWSGSSLMMLLLCYLRQYSSQCQIKLVQHFFKPIPRCNHNFHGRRCARGKLSHRCWPKATVGHS